MYNNTTPINPYGIMLDDLKMVEGYEAAQRYPTKSNSRTCLFDKNDNVFYVVETDGNGYKVSIGRYRFEPEPIEDLNDKKYASKEDLNELKEMIENVQHSLQRLSDREKPDTNDKFSPPAKYAGRNGKPNTTSGKSE